jgi:hypothetical protein
MAAIVAPRNTSSDCNRLFSGCARDTVAGTDVDNVELKVFPDSVTVAYLTDVLPFRKIRFAASGFPGLLLRPAPL